MNKRITTTAENMVKNFQETVKIYEQGKKYYDALKSVHNLVKDARKVQQTVLLVGEISDIYVNSFQKMLADENYTTDELAAIASHDGRTGRHRLRLHEDAGGKQRDA